MLRFLVAVAAMVLLASVAMTGVGAADGPADVSLEELPGEGTSDEPYELSNASELQAVSEDLTAHYVLADDIDASETADWNDGAGFDPIGDADDPFRGQFDGDNHTVSELTIDRRDEYGGLFGYVGENATVENVALEGGEIDVGVLGLRSYEGGLVGYNEGTVANVSVEGTSHGGSNTGGLVGYNEGTVTQAYANVELRGGGPLGGLIGYNEGDVSSVYATAEYGPECSDPVVSCTARHPLIGFNDDANATVDAAYSYADTNTNEVGTLLEADDVVGEAPVETMPGLDFEDTWQATPGTPTFQWQVEQPDLGGVGTDAEPFRIHDLEDLDEVRTNVSANYVLVDDVDASESAAWNDGDGFEPIGDADEPFDGHVDGNGYAIENLTIDRPAESDVGLFGALEDGTVANVRVDATVTGDERVGVLVGSNDGTVTATNTAGSAIGDRAVGGLAGQNDGAVSQSHTDAAVEGTDWVGGLVGFNSGGTVETSFAVGPVDGDRDVGGLVGLQSGGAVSDGYWDRETTGQADSDGGTGLTTDEMTSDDARDALEGFAFVTSPRYDERWVDTDGYPVLSWATDPIDLPGAGTAEDPYRLSDAGDLNAMRADTTAHYVLEDEIDASDTADWNGGDGFDPVGNESDASDADDPSLVFDGTLDGNGYAITGLTIDRGDEDHVGLFDELGSDAVVEDLRLETVDVTGDGSVGAVAGTSAGTVENVSTDGTVVGSASAERSYRAGGVIGKNEGTVVGARSNATVTGERRVGGLIGANDGALERSVASGHVEGEREVGGAVGRVGQHTENGSVSTTTANATVEGVFGGTRISDIGGLVGDNYNGTVERSAATGSVVTEEVSGEINQHVGGLAGSNGGTVTQSYAHADAVGGDDVAGLVGYVSSGGVVSKSYATGEVDTVESDLTGPDYRESRAGGVVANEYTYSRNNGTTVDAYWDVDRSGQPESANGTGLSNAALTGPDARESLEGFDFEDTWETTAGYPILSWQDDAGERAGDTLVAVLDAPSAVEPGESVTVDASESFDSAGEVVDVEVTVDGETTTAETTTHTFDDLGASDVSLTVTNDDGETDTTATTIDVVEDATPYEPPVAAFELEEPVPEIDQTENVATGTVNASASYSPTGEIERYGWDSGDGQVVSSDTETITYEYEEPGVYNATLTVTDNEGAENETTKQVVVVEEAVLPDVDGEGTADDPYRIGDVTELQAMAEDPSAHYVLVDDVDASETADWNDGEGFHGITGFDGHFDGNGHTIANLTSEDRYVYAEDGGVFRTVEDDGLVENVHIEDSAPLIAENHGTVENVSAAGHIGRSPIDVNGGVVANTSADVDVDVLLDTGGATTTNEPTGGLVGENEGTVVDSVVSGTIEGDAIHIGGAVGWNEGTVENVSADVVVDAEDDVGGLVGSHEAGEIVESSAIGDVNGSGRVGGLAGSSEAPITDSYATGDASGEYDVGGLVGHSSDAVSTTYALGDVRGDPEVDLPDQRGVGGLIGSVDPVGPINDAGGSVHESFAAGSVDGNDNVGGVIGALDAYNSDVDDLEHDAIYWDETAAGQNDSLVGTAVTTDELTGVEAVEHLEGFDFETTWKTTDSYPIHEWDARSGDEDRRESDWTAESTVRVDLETTAANPDDTVAATVDLRNPPAEAAGYEVRLEVADDAVATVDRLEAADGFAVTETETDVSSDRATIVLEPDDAPTDGGTVATADLVATAAGTTDVTAVVDVTADGTTATAGDDTTALEVEDVSVGPVAGTVPQDTTGDGLRNDFDGDGKTTHDDATVFFEHLEDDAVQNNPEAFDFDENDRIGFGDVIALLQEI